MAEVSTFLQSNSTLIIGVVVVGALAVFLFGVGLFLRAFLRKVDQGFAMIVNKFGAEPTVRFTNAIVIPLFHRVEIMDISLKTIEVDRQGTNGLICSDNIRADIKVAFFVRVNKTAEDVLKVAGAVGVQRASDTGTLEELFQAKFSEALKTVGKKMNFIDLYNERDQFKDQIMQVIGRDLNGYSLEDAAIDYLEQTPLKLLDPDNILDSEGRKKIIDLTTQQRVKANEIQREGEKVIKKQDVEAREALLALERQQAEAEAKQHREIATNRAREQAEEAKVQFEEHKRAEEARLSAEQEIGILRENSQREVEVGQEPRRRRRRGVRTHREKPRFGSHQPRTRGRADHHRKRKSPGDRTQEHRRGHSRTCRGRKESR